MLEKKENIYFVGIGGIGMSALARYFHHIGKKVAGYDRTTTDLTTRLQNEGMVIMYMDEPDAIPVDFKNQEDTLVVYTPAIPESNQILTHFQEEGYDLLKRAEVLGEISKAYTTIAIAGTHGKTTISTMVAYLLQESGIKINAFLGGLSRDYGSNLIVNEEAKIMVTEADEYDRSFLHLHPDIAVVSSMDADHLDIYGEADELEKTFKDFVGQIKHGGTLISKKELLPRLEAREDVKQFSYGLFEKEDYSTSGLVVMDEAYSFNFETPQGSMMNMQSGLPGHHNVENSLPALAIANRLGVQEEKLRPTLAAFLGVKRRFDIHLKTKDFIYIDDYAHHPEELKALFRSVNELYPFRKLCVIFQPHLFSRTKDFAEDFASVLSQPDETILLDIYPAREEPIEGVTSDWLLEQVDSKEKQLWKKEDVVKKLRDKEVEVLVTAGAGDIDTLVHPIIKMLEAR